MRISDWSSDVCSSDLVATELPLAPSTLPDGDHEPLLIQWEHVEAGNFEQGQVTPKGGKFMLDGLALGLQLCQQNIADAMCVAPLNKAALRAGGMKHPEIGRAPCRERGGQCG